MIFGVDSCENDTGKMANGKATIQFKLTDAPGLDYDEVNIDIIGVSVGVSNGNEPGEGDWIDLNMPVTGIFNLLAYSFVIDFDAARSVVKSGNGTYGLKPVIRNFAEAFGGSIKGFSLPALKDTVGVSHVQIVNDGDTLTSLPRETDGYFLFPGLKPALSVLTIVADTNTGFRDALFNDIQVLDGVVYDLGIVELEFD